MKNYKYVPHQVIWELTLKCNLKCLHCGSSAGSERTDELTTQEGLTLIHDLAEINTKQICFMGGEPFLRKDWSILAKKARDLGIEILFISNGFNSDRQLIFKLKQLEPYGVSVSLDGATAKTHDQIRSTPGSFERAMKFINLLQEEDLPVAVISTINKLNIDEVPKIKEMLFGRDIAWQIQVATPLGRFPKKFVLSKEEYYSLGMFIEHLQRSYSPQHLPVVGADCFGYFSEHISPRGITPWNGCHAGITTFSIKSNGDITGCLSTPEFYTVDNIRGRNVIDIWNDPNSFGYNRNFKNEDLGENCKDCVYGETCKGGCTGMSTSITGKGHNDPYCFHKIEKHIHGGYQHM